jgi:hypothetical protein
VVVVERFAENLDPVRREKLLGHQGVHRAEMADLTQLLPKGRQVTATAPCTANLLQLDGGGHALHLLNYGYDAAADRVQPLRDVDLEVVLATDASRATVVSHDGSRRDVEIRRKNGTHALTVPELGVYTVVVLHDDQQP